MRQATDSSSIASRRSLLAVIVMLAALATSLALFFGLGARPAAAQKEAVQAAEGARDENAEADKNAIIQRSPSAINFGPVSVGSSKDDTVTVTGVSSGCLITIFGTCASPLFGGGIGTPSISGPDAGNFAIVEDHCSGATLDPGQSCNIKVRFSPNNAQSFNATLDIPPHPNGNTSFGGNSSVALSGVGVSLPNPPVVIGHSPVGKNVAPGASPTATFSRAMLPSSINAGTFKLTKSGSSTDVAAVVTYDPAANKATLNPNSKLKRGATYTARVTTGAQDLGGFSLDQDPVNPGNQDATWTFRVKR